MLASAWAQNTPPNTAQYDVLVDMAAAFKKNDSKKLAKLLPRAKGHALESWAAYWALKVRLDEATQAELDGFYKRYAGTYVEDRLRADWLLLLGKNQDWILLYCKLEC